MMKTENSFNGFGWFSVLILFWIFWGQSGWYRIDCSLGVTSACDLIASEYKAQAKP